MHSTPRKREKSATTPDHSLYILRLTQSLAIRGIYYRGRGFFSSPRRPEFIAPRNQIAGAFGSHWFPQSFKRANPKCAKHRRETKATVLCALQEPKKFQLKVFPPVNSLRFMQSSINYPGKIVYYVKSTIFRTNPSLISQSSLKGIMGLRVYKEMLWAIYRARRFRLGTILSNYLGQEKKIKNDGNVTNW